MFGLKKDEMYTQEQRAEIKELTGRDKIPKVGTQEFRDMIEEIEALKPELARQLSEIANDTSATKGVHAKEIGRLKRRSKILGWITGFFSREDASGKKYTTLRPVGFVLIALVGLIVLGMFSYYGKMFGPTVISAFTGPPDPSVEAQRVQPTQQVSAPSVPLETVAPPKDDVATGAAAAPVPTEEPQPLQETNFAPSEGDAPRAAPTETASSSAPAAAPAAQPSAIAPVSLDARAAPAAMALRRVAPTEFAPESAQVAQVAMSSREPRSLPRMTMQRPDQEATSAVRGDEPSPQSPASSETPRDPSSSRPGSGPSPRFLSQSTGSTLSNPAASPTISASPEPEESLASQPEAQTSQSGGAGSPLEQSVLQPGRRLNVRLVTGVLIVPGASVPVAAETLPQTCATPAMCPKLTFLGNAELFSGNLVRFSFDRAIMGDGSTHEVSAIGLDMSNNPAVQAAIVDRAPAALPDLVRGSLGAFSDYVDALVDSSDVTVTDDAIISQSRTPGLGSFLAAAAAETFSFQEQTTAVVRTGAIPAGTPLQVISGLSH